MWQDCAELETSPCKKFWSVKSFVTNTFLQCGGVGWPAKAVNTCARLTLLERTACVVQKVDLDDARSRSDQKLEEP